MLPELQDTSYDTSNEAVLSKSLWNFRINI